MTLARRRRLARAFMLPLVVVAWLLIRVEIRFDDDDSEEEA